MGVCGSPRMMLPEARPRLHPKVRLRPDRASGASLLVYPERALRLNASAGQVLALCDGARRVVDVAAALAARHPGVPRCVLERDACDLLQRLVDRGLVQLVEETEPEATSTGGSREPSEVPRPPASDAEGVSLEPPPVGRVQDKLS